LFKQEWLTLISNNKRWQIYLIAISYFVAALVATFNDVDQMDVEIGKKIELLDDRNYKEVPSFQYYFDNDEYDEYLKEGDLINAASIPHEIVKGSFLPVFITYDKLYDRILSHYFDSLGVISDWDHISRDSVSRDLRSNRNNLSDILNTILIVEVNSERIDSIDWMYRNHPITDQEGWATKLDISNLPRGKHSLMLERQDKGTDGKGTFGIRWIPFWKE